MYKFWSLQSRIYESLRERNVTVDKLVTHLLSLHALDPVYKNSQKPVLIIFKELRNAGSIEDVMWIIRNYFSFFNCSLIGHIVNGLGTDQDKVELQNYKKEFYEYSKRRVYECRHVYGLLSGADYTDLVWVIDSIYEKFTLSELKKFEYRLSRLFCVSPQSVIHLCRVDGELIFQVSNLYLLCNTCGIVYNTTLWQFDTGCFCYF